MLKKRQTQNNFVRMLVALKEDIHLHRAALIIVAAFLLAGISSAKGDMITVGPATGCDFQTVQEAIDAAEDGDMVLVAPGEYVITEPVTFRGKAITVKSEAGPDETIIRMGIPTDPDRGSVVVFDNNETTESILDGFTLTKGKGSLLEGSLQGGGIFFDAASGVVRNCTIVQNSARRAGGFVCVYKSSPTLIDCTVAENSSIRSGGGLTTAYESSLILTDCVIMGNSSAESIGGGILCWDNSSVTLTNCTVADNSATNGGGIYSGDNSSINASNCIIKSNSATGSTPQVSGYGGGVQCWSNSLVSLLNCTMVENSAGQAGGAMFCEHSSLNVANCKIVNNTAQHAGGGVECVYSDSSMTISNCTIWGNIGGDYGGGVVCYEGSAILRNSIIWANTAPKGKEISLVAGSTMGVTYSNIKGGRTRVNIEGGSTLDWGEGNIDADPCFADPENEDYHLKSEAGRWDSDSQIWVQDAVTSPCVDAGDPMGPIGLEPFPNGGFVNMGAYGGTPEASKTYFGKPVCSTIIAGDINGDGQVNRTDLEIMALHWTDEEPLKAN